MKGTVRDGPLTEEEMILMAMVGDTHYTPWYQYLAVLTKERQLEVDPDARSLGQFVDWFEANRHKEES